MSPKPGERVFQKSYASTLMSIAWDDYLSAKTLAKNSKSRKETALFLVQQSIEKILKAVLCFSEVPVPLLHDLSALVARMPDGINPPYGYNLGKFNDYAGILRYERGNEMLTAKDVNEALKIAQEVYKWATKIVKVK